MASIKAVQHRKESTPKRCVFLFSACVRSGRIFEPHDLHSMTEHSSSSKNARGPYRHLRRYSALFGVSARRIADNPYFFNFFPATKMRGSPNGLLFRFGSEVGLNELRRL